MGFHWERENRLKRGYLYCHCILDAHRSGEFAIRLDMSTNNTAKGDCKSPTHNSRIANSAEQNKVILALEYQSKSSKQRDNSIYPSIIVGMNSGDFICLRMSSLVPCPTANSAL